MRSYPHRFLKGARPRVSCRSSGPPLSRAHGHPGPLFLCPVGLRPFSARAPPVSRCSGPCGGRPRPRAPASAVACPRSPLGCRACRGKRETRDGGRETSGTLYLGVERDEGAISSGCKYKILVIDCSRLQVRCSNLCLVMHIPRSVLAASGRGICIRGTRDEGFTRGGAARGAPLCGCRAWEARRPSFAAPPRRSPSSSSPSGYRRCRTW